jgi:hypothetical protein
MRRALIALLLAGCPGRAREPATAAPAPTAPAEPVPDAAVPAPRSPAVEAILAEVRAAEAFALVDDLVPRAEALDTGERAELLDALEAALPDLGEDGRGLAFGLFGVLGELDRVVRLATAYPEDFGAAFAELRGGPPRSAEELAAVLALAATPAVADEVTYTVLTYLEDGHLAAPQLVEHAAAFLDGYRALPATAEKVQRRGIYLDLFQHLPAEDVVDDLTAALDDPSTEVAMFAIASLAAHGRTPAAAAIARVAADDAQRGTLVELLDRHGRRALVPKRWRTQAMLARADLVRWLTFPTELGQPPDEIEEVEVDSSGHGDVYHFRFRVDAPHALADRGWMRGWAGPYATDQPPQTHGPDTFSDFEPAQKR